MLYTAATEVGAVTLAINAYSEFKKFRFLFLGAKLLRSPK